MSLSLKADSQCSKFWHWVTTPLEVIHFSMGCRRRCRMTWPIFSSCKLVVRHSIGKCVNSSGVTTQCQCLLNIVNQPYLSTVVWWCHNN